VTSALYIPYENPDPSRKCRRKYGDKINYSFIPEHFFKETNTNDDVRTDIYQAQLLHKEYSQALNVVILVRTNIKTSHQTHAVLFSTDLDLSYDKLIDYYSLRFQIEFNFRDAKQFWGLEDFMKVGKTAVTNAANLAFFMVNVSQVLLSHFRQFNPDFSITDLKALFRGYKYVEETIKLISGKTRLSFTYKYFPQSHQCADVSTQLVPVLAVLKFSEGIGYGCLITVNHENYLKL
jgi:putative transposase